MKIYVVMKGEYSDRHIVGVCDNEERAETVRKLVSGRYEYDVAYIEEYDTDHMDIISEDLHPYAVEFSKSATIIRVNRMIEYGDGEEIDDWERFTFVNGPYRVEEFNYFGGGYRCIAYVAAIDEEHAKKIACDNRAKYLYAKMVDEAV